MAEGRRQGFPDTLGGYAVLGRLATGGMAELFLGRRLGPAKSSPAVAIKTILPHLARNSRFVTMFLDEAKIAASIRHPNVVHVEELGTDGDELYMVMEYLAGEPVSVLHQRLVSRGRSLEAWLGAFVVAEACGGIHAAHELRDDDGSLRNVVHRDLSPPNIFVTYDGRVKIIDFGVAKAADRLTATETGCVKGKFEYMSPEQVMGQPIDRRSDVFALGIVLFELLTGRRLFKGANDAATVRNVIDRRVDPPSSFAVSIPSTLDEICLKALARSVELRYATAQDMRLDLVAAICAMQPDVLSGRRLSALMHELFPGRIATKMEMLRQAREEDIVEVDEIEAEIEIEMPSVMSDGSPDPESWTTDHVGRGLKPAATDETSTDPQLVASEPLADQETKILPLKDAEGGVYPDTHILPLKGATGDIYPDTHILPLEGATGDIYPDTRILPLKGAPGDVYPATHVLPPTNAGGAAYADTQILPSPGADREPSSDARTDPAALAGREADEDPGSLDKTNLMVVADLETRILIRPDASEAAKGGAGQVYWWVALVAVTVLGLIVGVGAVIVSPDLEPKRPVPAPRAQTVQPPLAVVSPVRTPVALPPRTVRLTVASEPGGAAVLVDGVERLKTPGALTIDRGDAPVKVRLVLKGFQAREELVVPNSDRQIMVTLVEEPPPPPPPVAAPPDAGAEPAKVVKRRPGPRVRRTKHSGPETQPEPFELWE